MEKSGNSKKKMLKFWPKAAAAAAVILMQNIPFSPGREKRLVSDHHSNPNRINHKSHLHHNNNHHRAGGLSMIPAEARSSKSGNNDTNNQEPTSPKVSCIGTIKHNNKKKMIRSTSSRTIDKNHEIKRRVPKLLEGSSSVSKKKSESNFGNIFKGRLKSRRTKSEDVLSENVCRIPDRAPCLSQMKRFASGHDTLSNFDWKEVQITPDDHRKYYSDDDIYDQDYDEEDEKVIAPYSDPILVGGGRTNICLEPRKEINLWKRRTMSQPEPLRLNTNIVS